MDGTILHFLDGSQVEEPKGWGDFSEELDRDVRERLIGVKYAVGLTFTGGGYKYLDAQYNTQGHCGAVSYEARQWCGGELQTCSRGTIILADVQWNETKCEAECDIADDGVGTRVVNNKDIPVSPTAELTKNEEALTPVTTLALEVFDPQAAAGTWIGSTRNAWDWYEAIQHCIAYITDNTVTVVSDWYPALPDNERYAFVYGNELRTASGANTRFTYSWKILFTELAMKYNLWVGVERDNSGNPVLRIEPESYFYGTTGSLSLLDLQDLIRSTDTDRMYAKVNVGSDTYEKEFGATLSLPYLVLRGHSKEEFHFEGVCNTTETLDLVNEWNIDTNLIEDVVVNGNDEHDDELFLIQYTESTSRATKGDYLNPGSGPYLYNEQLQNSLVVGRYDLPSPVGSFFSTTDASFQAHRTNAGAPEFYASPAGSSTPAIVQFDHDYPPGDFDTTNAWGNGTPQGNPVSQANSRYTAAAQGYFEFDISVRWILTKNVPNAIPFIFYLYKTIRPQIQLERYNAANTLIGTPQYLAFDIEYTPGLKVNTGTIGVSLDVGDYVQLTYQWVHTAPIPMPFFAGPQQGPFEPIGITLHLDSGSFIRTSFVTGGGYVSGSGQARIIKYEFERPIALQEWLNLTGSPGSTIGIGGGSTVAHTTHVLNATRNVKTGETQWAVIKRP